MPLPRRARRPRHQAGASAPASRSASAASRFDRQPIADLDPSAHPARPPLRRGHRRATWTQGRGLWFYGDVGTGKTSLAMLVSKAALDAGPLGGDLLGAAPARRDQGTPTTSDAGAHLPASSSSASVEVDLLVLDDLGAEKRTEWVLEQLYSLVNERWQDAALDRGHDRTWTTSTSCAQQIGERTRLAPDRDVGPTRVPRSMGRDRAACSTLDAASGLRTLEPSMPATWR